MFRLVAYRFQYQRLQRLNVSIAVVERRNILQFFAAGFFEKLPVLNGNFLQRFQAVHCEAGTDHLYVSDSFRGQSLERLIRIGL